MGTTEATLFHGVGEDTLAFQVGYHPRKSTFEKHSKRVFPGGGGFSNWHGTHICACLLGCLFREIWYGDRGFSSGMKEPKSHKLGVFWANYCKKHPIWSKLGAFSKMVYWWVGNQAKPWYRESQILEVRQAHPRTILVKVTPPGVCFPYPNWVVLQDVNFNTSLTWMCFWKQFNLTDPFYVFVRTSPGPENTTAITHFYVNDIQLDIQVAT